MSTAESSGVMASVRPARIASAILARAGRELMRSCSAEFSPDQRRKPAPEADLRSVDHHRRFICASLRAARKFALGKPGPSRPIESNHRVSASGTTWSGLNPWPKSERDSAAGGQCAASRGIQLDQRGVWSAVGRTRWIGARSEATTAAIAQEHISFHVFFRGERSSYNALVHANARTIAHRLTAFIIAAPPHGCLRNPHLRALYSSAFSWTRVLE